MKRKGFTLIEIILAITMISVLATAFLSLISFSYTNLIDSEKFTEAMFEDQSIVEEQIDASRFSSPPNPGSNYVEVFGVNVPVHLLSVNTTTSGQVKVYLPQQTTVPIIPIIQSPPKLIVKNHSDINVSPQPTTIHIFDDQYKLFVSEVDITAATKNEHLMNVYRWYVSDEISSEESASSTIDDYVVVQEWNEAKAGVTYSDAFNKGFIPNMKEYTDSKTRRKNQYNELDYEILKNAYSYNHQQIINNFGNRYVRYSVTPFSLSGRMGLEELSEPIYIEAPRIEVLSAEFEEKDEEDIVVITFNLEIEDSFSLSSIVLNEELGELALAKRDEDDPTKMILKFKQPINTFNALSGNLLNREAVISKDYGAISIWYNNYPNNSFTITP